MIRHHTQAFNNGNFATSFLETWGPSAPPVVIGRDILGCQEFIRRSGVTRAGRPDTRIPGYGQGTNSELSSAPAQGPGHKNFPLLETNDPEMFQSIQDWLGKKTNSEINILIIQLLFIKPSVH